MFFHVAICLFDRITNGNFATDQQFPYAVSIQQQGTEQNVSLLHRCGGVLITFQHVLTTASCTYNTVNGTNVPIVANEYRVFAGSAVLTNNNSANQVRTITNYTVHPQYLGAPSMLNDIAVITLASPFPNTAVVPLGLPVANFIPEEHTECTVAGWGASAAGNNASSQLRFATNYIYNQALCTTLHNSIVGVANILPSMICAASYDITSVGCTGDEGNALVCNGQLTGILSITNNCQATSYPEVYTRVSNYTTWVRSVTAGASSVKPEVVFLGLFTLFQIVTIKIFS
ncbi:hypothetical protein K1T71_005648 [Dendrolimus kikuchii]|uniref:Uncharacterized protein n=1 Tax=Dendrolimus kikuchii TaxID=765133 RepID=A0ACC1D5K0_9NEOP|nr:hypothetical protein K1T71_005648 [Dendrolimus kikuchii]